MSLSQLAKMLLTQPSASLPVVLPILLTVVYLGVNAGLKGWTAPRGPLKVFSIVHNAGMSIFSAIMLVKTVTFLAGYPDKSFIVYGSCHDLMDVHGSPLEMLGTYFFWSKAYEFIDTWIVILKGKQPIFLQTFHHVGAVWITWVLTAARADSIYIFIVLNSTIHTIMYFYYFLTCFGYRPKWSVLLTSMQIAQFIIGLASSIPYFIGLPCNVGLHYWAIVANNVYVVALVILFVSFFRNKYLAGKAAKAKAS